MSQVNNYRRYNPLLDEWVIVAANRVNRPWQGATTDTSGGFAKCTEVNPLAPGGKRANGTITPDYTKTYVFDNDFPSFTHFDKAPPTENEELFKSEEIKGICRVLSYHPDSQKTMAVMTPQELRGVVDTWIEQYRELSQKYSWVQSRGAAVGCSNSHPHGQIWAGNFLPNLPNRKDNNQRVYYEKHGRPMLVDYVEQEMQKKERIVIRNHHWTVLVPYWAMWPYETMLFPNRHVLRFTDLTAEEKDSLASTIQLLMIKYDNIFKCTFPFGMGWMNAPGAEYLEKDCRHWQLHAIYHPPLLRSATVPKYMAGYEQVAESQRDITAEMAAKVIREQSDVHYTKENS